MSDFVVQYDDQYYVLLGPDGEVGEPVELGLVATVRVRGQDYGVCIDLDPDGDGEPDIVMPVRLLGAEQRMRLEEVERMCGEEFYDIEESAEPGTGEDEGEGEGEE